MPKSVESDRNKNMKSVFVEEGLSQPKFVFDRSNKTSKKSSDKSNDKSSRKFKRQSSMTKPKRKNKKSNEKI